MAELDDFHAEKTARLAQKESLDRMFQGVEEQPQQAVKQVDEAAQGEQQTAKVGAPVPAGGVASDMAEGVLETPSQILGGAAEAVNETMSLIRDIGDWANENIVDLGHIVYTGEDGLEHLSTDEFKARFASDAEFYERDRDYVPETPEADSVTGGIVRGISQFVTGFIGAGKIKALQGLRAAGTAGRITSDAIRGAISDFAVFDPHEARLSNLIEQYPALQNPVTEFLQAKPDDTAAEGRLKNAVEGIIPGVAIDGLAEMFTRGVRALRSARGAADTVLSEVDEVAQAVEVAQTQRARVKELIGDPEQPLLSPVAADAAESSGRLRPKPMDVNAEDLARGGTSPETFVNWSRIDTPDDVKAIIQEMANLNKEGIDEARRGVVGWQQTKLDAEAMDAFDILASRRQGQPLNNAETVAVRELWARSGTKLRQLTDEVLADPSEINKIAFRKMLAVHNSIQEQVVAARTETARALNAWKIPAGSDAAFIGQMDQLRSYLSAEDATEEIAKGLKALTDAGMIKEADQFVYGSPWAKTADGVAQLWYFSLLSGPKTHMRNGISNTAVLLNQMLERKAANLIGAVKGAKNVPDGETSAMMFGMVQGFRDAFRISSKGRQAIGAAIRAGDTAPIADAAGEFGTAWRAGVTGESGIGIGKIELPRMGAFSPEKLGLDKQSGVGRVMSVLDTVTTLPGRALNMADEVFKSANYRAELNAQAFRRATKELAEGKITDVQGRIAEMMNDPDTAMQMAARFSAETNTFTNTPLNTKPWQAFKAIGEVPVLGKIVLPFRRTPYNIATYTFQRTPLAPLVKQWRNEIAKGGAQADLAWSKFLTGNAILLTMADLAMNGDLTGEGPSNMNQRATERRMGEQPSSVRVNVGTDDAPEYRYFSYRGLEPMATSLGISSNIVDILRSTDWEDDNAEIDELVIAASMAIANQVTSQQYMSGLSDFFNAMSDPQRYGESWWNRLAGAAMPTGVAEIARTQDPYLRAVHDMTDAFMARTPGLSDKLPHKRDAWGRPITRESGLGSFYDAVSPIYSRAEDAQPIDLELQRLETWIGKPPKRTSFNGITVNLDRYPAEYDRWTQLQGQEITETVYGAPISAGGFVSSGKGLMDELNMLTSGKHPNYPKEMYGMLSDGPDGGKANLLRQVINAYRDAAKEYLLAESPTLRAEVDSRKNAQQGRYIFQ